MEITVQQQNIPVSPKKARLLFANMKGKKLSAVLDILRFLPQKSAYYFRKILQNGKAIADDKNLDQENLYIKAIQVDQARPLKRMQYKPRGRADLITKSRSHFRITLIEKKSEDISKKPIAKNHKPKLKKSKEQTHGSKS